MLFLVIFILLLLLFLWIVEEPSRKYYTFLFLHRSYKAYQHLYNEIPNLVITDTFGSDKYKTIVIKGNNIVIHIYTDFIYVMSQGIVLTEFEDYYWNKLLKMLSAKFPELVHVILKIDISDEN